jgi:hypothetical protein
MAFTLAERRKLSGDRVLNRASNTPDGSRHSAYMIHNVSQESTPASDETMGALFSLVSVFSRQGFLSW